MIALAKWQLGHVCQRASQGMNALGSVIFFLYFILSFLAWPDPESDRYGYRDYFAAAVYSFVWASSMFTSILFIFIRKIEIRSRIFTGIIFIMICTSLFFLWALYELSGWRQYSMSFPALVNLLLCGLNLMHAAISMRFARKSDSQTSES